jgi:hypothetical protein
MKWLVESKRISAVVQLLRRHKFDRGGKSKSNHSAKEGAAQYGYQSNNSRGSQCRGVHADSSVVCSCSSCDCVDRAEGGGNNTSTGLGESETLATNASNNSGSMTTSS